MKFSLFERTVRHTLRFLLFVLFRTEVHGLKNLDIEKKNVIVVSNHLSFLDALIVGLVLERRLSFIINTAYGHLWWIRWLGKFSPLYVADPTKPLSIRSVIQGIKEGGWCVIFPEGRITVTGALMKVYEGPGMIAEMADASILPIRIEGAQYSVFSRLKGKVKRRLFPKISVHIMPFQKLMVDEGLNGRAKRQALGTRLYDLMSNIQFATMKSNRTIAEALLDAYQIHGGGRDIIEDVNRKVLTFKQLITRTNVLSLRMSRDHKPGEKLGIMLPSTTAAVASFYACHFASCIPVMINFTTGARQVVNACKTAQVTHVFTARKFIENAKLEDLVESMKAAGVKVIMLEDYATTITTAEKIKGALQATFPGFIRSRVQRVDPTDPAVILFTSGSEGVPKGVALSHRNIEANINQVTSSIDLNSEDIFFNVLPVFHSFGLTAGAILPTLNGIKAFHYPSPLHYRIIPELVYDTNATVFFATDTFLGNYARYAHPYDFYSVRYLVAGAERLRAETRQTYSEKFGIRVLEGYGVTETAPVISINTPMLHRVGSVGRPVPGIEYKLEQIEGIEEGRKLLVRGPNVMMGYLYADNPGKIVPLKDGWHDTGDIVHIDEDNFIFIRGRHKRFAKIGGEMVSLAAVEIAICEIWPQATHAVVSLPDPKKGEQVVLLTTQEKARREDVQKYFSEHALGELGIPRNVYVVEDIPLLGNGKTNYVVAREMALSLHKGSVRT